MRLVPLFVAVAAVVPITPASGSAPRFIPTGHAPGVPVESQNLGLSTNGQWAVGRTFLSGVGSVANRWSETGGLETLGQFNGSTIGNGISNNGVAVGIGGAASSAEEAWMWSPGSGYTGLGFLSGTTTSRATDINGPGTVVVGGSGNQAFRWTQADGMVSLGSAPFLSSAVAQAVSDDGNRIAGEGNGVAGVISAGWYWDNGSFTDIGHMNPAVRFTRVFNLSADGSTVVGWSLNSNFNIEAFRWRSGSGMQPLGAFNPGSFSFESFATDASADGEIVIGSSRAPDAHRAFIWTQATGILDLQTHLETTYGIDFGGWLLQEAQGISADGSVISGYGTNPGGVREGWVIIVPEPGSAAMLVLAATALLGRKRKF